jgi:hypothetical protein
MRLAEIRSGAVLSYAGQMYVFLLAYAGETCSGCWQASVHAECHRHTLQVTEEETLMEWEKCYFDRAAKFQTGSMLHQKSKTRPSMIHQT